MTDKEWKKLYKWAENYSDKVYLKGVLDVCYGIDVYINNQMIMQVDKYGDLKIHTHNKNINVDVNIADNRTAKQIKAIIKNLIEEVYYG